jgi:hypothetical protein
MAVTMATALATGTVLVPGASCVMGGTDERAETGQEAGHGQTSSRTFPSALFGQRADRGPLPGRARGTVQRRQQTSAARR